MIKLVYCIRRKSSLTREAFQEYWRGPHADLVKCFAKQIGALRYVQSHALDSKVADASNAIRKSNVEPFDGITEFWWQSKEELQQPTGSTPELVIQAQKSLIEDERAFIDLANSSIFICEEHEIFDYSNTREAVDSG